MADQSMPAPSINMTLKVAATSIMMAGVGSANLTAAEDSLELACGLIPEGLNCPNSQQTKLAVNSTMPSKCCCGVISHCAANAPNKPAHANPMLQKACALFMMRRPSANSTRSASKLITCSRAPMQIPAGTRLKNK